MSNYIIQNGELCHFGVKGMKWGVRRYQDQDGRLTSAGRKRYIADKTKGVQKDIDSYAPYRKTGIKTNDGKLVMTTKDIDEIVKGLEQAKNLIASKAGQKYDKIAAKVNSNIELKNKSKEVIKKVSNKPISAAKQRENELRKNVDSIFKKHPDLYDDFGGPDQIDDFELLELVMMERGYDK